MVRWSERVRSIARFRKTNQEPLPTRMKGTAETKRREATIRHRSQRLRGSEGEPLLRQGKLTT
jgi:hypothetical protein